MVYGPNNVPQTAYNNQIQNPNQTQPNPNYANWITPNQSQQPQQLANEQRGITAVYMVNSKNEYGFYIPPAGQTIALFNFPERELCLKARDMYGVDLSMRTWAIQETTPSVQGIQNGSQTQPQAPVIPQEATVPKSEFDDLKAKFESLYKELKG